MRSHARPDTLRGVGGDTCLREHSPARKRCAYPGLGLDAGPGRRLLVQRVEQEAGLVCELERIVLRRARGCRGGFELLRVGERRDRGRGRCGGHPVPHSSHRLRAREQQRGSAGVSVRERSACLAWRSRSAQRKRPCSGGSRRGVMGWRGTAHLSDHLSPLARGRRAPSSARAPRLSERCCEGEAPEGEGRGGRGARTRSGTRAQAARMRSDMIASKKKKSDLRLKHLECRSKFLPGVSEASTAARARARNGSKLLKKKKKKEDACG